jgi:ribonuclease HI
MEKQVIIYCDGACLGNPGPGGYAALLLSENKEKVVFGHENLTTNNRMELKAAIEGLRALKRKCQVKIFSDSQYVVKGMNEWIKGWQKNGFKNAKKQNIANADLWIELWEISLTHKVSFHWVRGHAGNELNERVDEIAKEQAGIAFHIQAKI